MEKFELSLFCTIKKTEAFFARFRFSSRTHFKLKVLCLERGDSIVHTGSVVWGFFCS